MRLSKLNNLAHLALMTLRAPKTTLRSILYLQLNFSHVVQAAVMIVALSVIFQALTLYTYPPEVIALVPGFFQSPLQLFSAHILIIFTIAALVTYVGQFFGGQGVFRDALIAFVWQQFVLFGFQVIQLFVSLSSIELGQFINFIGILIMLYLSVAFIMEIHQFKNIFAVILVMAVTFVGFIFILSTLLFMLGVTPEVLQNV